jgi:hypothetical protein
MLKQPAFFESYADSCVRERRQGPGVNSAARRLAIAIITSSI